MWHGGSLRRMRVMSWNLWWRFDSGDQVTVGPPPHGDDWRRRGQGILATLDDLRPDIVGLQEVWATAEATQAELLAGELGMHSAFASPSLPPPPVPPRSPDEDAVDLGVAVLSRWPVLSVRRYPLPSGHRPEVVALAVAVEHPRGPLHIVVSCLDWDLAFAAQRLAQTRALAALLTDPSRDGPLPVLLAGDLNAPPTTSEIAVLTEVATDAWVAAGGDADGGHTLSSDNPYAPREAWQIDQRIDYVMARPGTPQHPVVVEGAFVAGDPVDGLHPSDHYAVVADLSVQSGPQVEDRRPGRSS